MVFFIKLVSYTFRFDIIFMCQRLKEGKTLAFVCGVGQILGKCEFLNPGGSVKDRVAVKIIEEVNYYYF